MYKKGVLVNLSAMISTENKIHFISLGCARNLVDTEVMLGILLKQGYVVTEEAKEADILVVNTCGFLQASRDESCETIDQLIAHKKEAAKVVVAGCMVQKFGDELKARFPKVHYFLGSGDVEKILEAVHADQKGAAITSARSYLEQGEIPRQVSTPKHYAYLKIAEGCAKQCSFCIIPKIKGPLKSKTEEQVLKEIRTLYSSGAKEIILIAQDLGDFGKEKEETCGFEKLLEKILEEPGEFWIRLLYLYPDEITDELILLFKKDKRLCRYLDMPIQHVNDRILKMMRRKTNKAHIVETITKLRNELPDIVIRTSLMVGFPGETDEEFEELVTFVQEHPLDNVGIFKFSSEELASASKFAGHVSEEVKQKRFERLSKVQEKSVKKLSRKYIGKKLSTVVEGYHPETNMLMQGRFYGQSPEIDGMVIINDGRKVTSFGKRYLVEITDVAGYDLIGRVV